MPHGIIMKSHGKSESDKDAGAASWRYAFPDDMGRDWSFTVPSTLVDCVGRYARIPQYARHSAILTRFPTDGEPGCDDHAPRHI
jgi:hypothetical protein